MESLENPAFDDSCPECGGQLHTELTTDSQKYPWIAKCNKCRIAFYGKTKEQAVEFLKRIHNEDKNEKNRRQL